MPDEDPPPRPRESPPPANAPPEALLAWPPLVRYLDACILRATRPWARHLRAEDLAAVRTRAYAELCLDPILRGLLRRLARGLGERHP